MPQQQQEKEQGQEQGRDSWVDYLSNPDYFQHEVEEEEK